MSFKDNISDRKFKLGGYVLLATLLLSFGLWSITAQVRGAVISSGRLEVETGRHVVQHKYGGNVDSILVKENSEVQQGQTLIELDDTELRAQHGIAVLKYYQALAQSERLRAEAQKEQVLSFSEEITTASQDHIQVQDILNAETALFDARLNNYNQQQHRFEERSLQLEQLVNNSKEQVDELEKQLSFNQEELDRQEKLFKQKLTRSNELTSTRNLLSETRSSLNDARSAWLDYQSQLDQNETALQTLNTDFLEKVYTQLGETEQELAQLREEFLVIEDQLKRLAIVAPNDGHVYGLTLNSTEAVISPAEPIMYVVPSNAPLVVKSSVNSQDIDEVFLDQEAEITFSGLHNLALPKLKGEVRNITADAILDERTGQEYFEIETEINMDELLAIEGVAFRPGMPAEVYLVTAARTPMDYFTEPLTRFFDRAMR